MKFLIAALLLPGLSLASILPDTIGQWHRVSASPAAVADRALWDEYGLKESEAAAYDNGAEKFTATVWRLQDTTGAMAAFEWQRADDSTPSNAARLAAEKAGNLLLVHGNYLLSFSGYKPAPDELKALLDQLKNVDLTVLPSLLNYLPAAGLNPNSERYVVGPVGLARFDPRISPSVAAFRYGTEARLAAYHSPKGDMILAIFNYPTAQIAMERAPDFEKVPGALVKRSGPLVAVTVSPPDPDFAEQVLAGVRYEAEITRSEYVPTRRDNIGVIILDIFVLIGILIAFSVVAGLAVGGVRTWLRRGKSEAETEAMITLHLGER